MSHSLLQLTADNFDDNVIKSEKPVLVDFWAEWCGPCKAFAPLFEEAAVDYNDRVLFAKLNVDDHQEIAVKYGIRGIPTIMIFHKGDVVGTMVGANSKAELAKFIDSHI